MATTISGRQIRDGTVQEIDLSDETLEKLRAPLIIGDGTQETMRVGIQERVNIVGTGSVNIGFDDTSNTITVDGGAVVPEDRTYVHNQITPESLWNISHQLNGYPSVTIVDSSNSVVYGDISYIDMNHVQLNVTSEFAGRAFLNVNGNGTFVHNQMVSESIWTIPHTLNKYPSVTIVDSTDTVVYGDYKYISTSEIEITFSSEFSGKVYLN